MKATEAAKAKMAVATTISIRLKPRAVHFPLTRSFTTLSSDPPPYPGGFTTSRSNLTGDSDTLCGRPSSDQVRVTVSLRATAERVAVDGEIVTRCCEAAGIRRRIGGE